VVCRPAFADDDPALDVLAVQAPQVAVEVVNHRLIDDAMSHLGVRYRYGGSTPQTGFDCSGLVRWVFDQSVGVVLPRRAIEIAQLGAKIDMDDLKPGDLVFFNTLRKTFSHVGIYLGDGRFVHAPSRGGKVRVEELDDNYWRTRFTGGRRITDGDAPMPSIR
jgi:cell wall-associated NlpC family hydrolase